MVSLFYSMNAREMNVNASFCFGICIRVDVFVFRFNR